MRYKSNNYEQNIFLEPYLIITPEEHVYILHNYETNKIRFQASTISIFESI